MIQDQKQIEIDAPQEKIFAYIETMPNKFPVYKILETKPFFFLRILFVDGFRAAVEVLRIEKAKDTLVLNLDDSMGPFQLTQLEKPLKYGFTLRSFFFNCQTGYCLSSNGNMTTLYFDLIAEDSGLMEKIWWFFVKPIHGLLANKVLKVIKGKVESK
ncbi:MAG: hypothetical protein GY797_20490 [Deltaproteobacteria bacterium]|nr:hypothetical protein [Deltaproteobacteria bacterium]